MVKIIMGLKGSGKTKKLVELVREAVNVGDGDVVCIEKDRKLTYDIPYQARLIDAGAYAIGTYEFLKGFISGIHAGNYDITELYVDGILKVGGRDYEALGKTLAAVDALAGENVKVIVTVSADEAELPDSVKKYL